MQFREFYKSSTYRENRVKYVEKSFKECLRSFLKEQIKSIGDPSCLYIKENIVHYLEEDIPFECFCEDKAGEIKVYIEFADNRHICIVDPEYFKSRNTSNYLREFMNNVKRDFFYQARKVLKK
ncbi:MAG: hypothetical protein ACOCV1_03040 [Bacillota bacterium]